MPAIHVVCIHSTFSQQIYSEHNAKYNRITIHPGNCLLVQPKCISNIAVQQCANIKADDTKYLHCIHHSLYCAFCGITFNLICLFGSSHPNVHYIPSSKKKNKERKMWHKPFNIKPFESDAAFHINKLLFMCVLCLCTAMHNNRSVLCTKSTVYSALVNKKKIDVEQIQWSLPHGHNG